VLTSFSDRRDRQFSRRRMPIRSRVIDGASRLPEEEWCCRCVSEPIDLHRQDIIAADSAHSGAALDASG